MRVVLATCMSIPHTGGASTHFELLSQSLGTAGMLVGRVTGQDAAPSRSRKALSLIRNIANKDSRRLEMIRVTASRLSARITSLVGSGSVDVLHCHDPLAAYAAIRSPAVRNLGIPVIQTIHGPWSREALTSGVTEDSRFYKELRRIEAAVFADCGGLIAVDRGQAQILIDEFGTPADKISVIHNAVNCREIQALSAKPGHLSLPKPYFVVPRRFVPKNGVHVAIEALDLVVDRRVHLAIAGDGPLARDLRALAEQKGLSDRVHFLGSLSREQLMPLMAGGSGVIIPSVPSEGVVEATSLAVIESFACGVPVIASNIGGLAELIRHGETGLLTETNDASSLAQAMTRILTMSEEERCRMCAAAGTAALARWDVTPWFTMTLAVYADVSVPASRAGR